MTIAVSDLGTATPRAVTPGNDANTTLLLHMDGTNGSTSFPDSGAGPGTPHNMTVSGTVTCDTSQPLLGGPSSAKFVPNGFINSNGNFVFGPAGGGDFTIDFWVKFSSLPGVSMTLIGTYYISNNTGWQFTYQTGPNGLHLWANTIASTVAWTPTLNTWYHVAFERFHSSVNAFVNGVLLGTLTDGSFTSGTSLVVGANANSTYGFNGWMKEVRISNIARYQGVNFTPQSVEYGSLIPVVSGVGAQVLTMS